MARLATLMREVSKRWAKWSPQPRSVLLRAVESPTTKTVGRWGLRGWSVGRLCWVGVGGGVVDWAGASGAKRVDASRNKLRIELRRVMGGSVPLARLGWLMGWGMLVCCWLFG